MGAVRSREGIDAVPWSRAMTRHEKIADGTREQMLALGHRARAAQRAIALASPKSKTEALPMAAARLRSDEHIILEANAVDVSAGREAGMSGAFLDRLLLDKGRIEGVARSLETIAALPDPVGQATEAWTRPNGMRIERVRV